MPVFATLVIFGVFAMPVLSGSFHWNLLAGQCLSQPCFKPEGRIHKCIKGKNAIEWLLN